MKKLQIIFLAGFLSLIMFINPAFAARYDYGKPGIYNLTPFTLSDGEGSSLSTDNHGQLLISPSSTVSVTAGAALPTATTLTYIYDNSAAATNIKNTAGRFHSMHFDNTVTSTEEFIQFFNTSTVPSVGAIPLLSFAIKGGGSIIVDSSYFQYLQKYFSNGIAIGISTSYKTYTASPDFLLINGMVEYD